MISKSQISNLKSQISNFKSEISNPQSAIHNPQSHNPLLEISDLRVYFRTDNGLVQAVDGVSLQIAAGETLGLVGESGCGKSVTAYSILKLLPVPPAEYAGGEISFRGEDLLTFNDKAMRRVRGNLISMIFQEPMSSLNPIMSIGAQITEAIREHRKASRREARDIAVDMLRRVGRTSPRSSFPEDP